MDTDIRPFKQIVRMPKGHLSVLLNYSQAKANSGEMEGINTKIHLPWQAASEIRAAF
jgi:transposase